MAIVGTDRCIRCELYLNCIRYVHDVTPPCARNVEAVDNSAQPLKPKIPSFVESMNLSLGADWALSDRCLLYEKQCRSLYEYIARHFGH
jgi:hypothetical protein